MKVRLTLITVLISIVAIAQNGINYKALIKDDLGNVIANSLVDIKFQILESDTHTNVYEETHNPTTDNNGIIIVNIGEGTVISGIFDSINWGNDEHFLNVKIDTGSGFVDLGTTQFSAVPYALHAKKAANVKGLEPLDEGNGIGWRLVGRNATNYDNIGFNAIDLSFINNPNLGLGATGNYAFSLGLNGTASGEHALAFGNQNYALNDYAIALGNNNNVTGLNSTAIGGTNQASGDYAFVAGLQNEASGNQTVVLGASSIASGEFSIAMGQNTTASGANSTTFGTNTEAIGDRSVAMGSGAESQGDFSFAFGNESEAQGDNSIAMGDDAFATNDYAVAIGRDTYASGYASTALGSNTYATNSLAFSTGSVTQASGYASTAMGNFTEASGNIATAIGDSTNAIGDYSTAIGRYSDADAFISTAIGIYNYGGGNPTSWIENDPLFEIGNGTSFGNRSNALTVLKNGNVGIGTHTPQDILHISGGRLRIGNETIEDGGSDILAFSSSIVPTINGIDRLGGPNRRWLDVYTMNGVFQTSDRRSKTNIENLNYGLNEILQIQPVSFNWKNKNNPDTKLGLIAQDLQALVPEVVQSHTWETDEATGVLSKKELDRLGVYYSDLVPVLINAIKEQQDIINNLKSTIQNNNNTIQNQEQLYTEQSKVLDALLIRVETLEKAINQ